jgi:hypothetical protein
MYKTKIPFDQDRMNCQESADYLGTKKGTLATWRSTGRHNLPYYRIGQEVFYRKSELDEFINTMRLGVRDDAAA